MFVLIMASKHNLDLFCCQPVFVDPKTVRSISSGSATNSDIGFISLRLRFFVARRQRRLRPQISVLIGSEFEKIPLAIWLESVSTVFIPFDTSFCIARETGFFLFGPSGLDGAIRGRCVRVVMRGCPYTSAIDSVWPFFFQSARLGVAASFFAKCTGVKMADRELLHGHDFCVVGRPAHLSHTAAAKNVT